nr:MAG TPA: hypothetical protein [Caudoviricetes sp.]
MDFEIVYFWFSLIKFSASTRSIRVTMSAASAGDILHSFCFHFLQA